MCSASRAKLNSGNRPKTTTKREAKATTTSTPSIMASVALTLSTSRGTSMAARRKIRELAQKPNCCQMFSSRSHVVGVNRVRPTALSVRAATTTATTPDTAR